MIIGYPFVHKTPELTRSHDTVFKRDYVLEMKVLSEYEIGKVLQVECITVIISSQNYMVKKSLVQKQNKNPLQ